MKYQKIIKYKYRLYQECFFHIPIYLDIDHELFSLHNGVLRVNEGYMWDGVSGPTWDSKNTMLGGLLHDVLYQMIRLELIPLKYKTTADMLFKEELRKSGMSSFRAWYYYEAVDKFGASSCVPGDVKIPEVLVLN